MMRLYQAQLPYTCSEIPIVLNQQETQHSAGVEVVGGNTHHGDQGILAHSSHISADVTIINAMFSIVSDCQLEMYLPILCPFCQVFCRNRLCWLTP